MGTGRRTLLRVLAAQGSKAQRDAAKKQLECERRRENEYRKAKRQQRKALGGNHKTNLHIKKRRADEWMRRKNRAKVRRNPRREAKAALPQAATLAWLDTVPQTGKAARPHRHRRHLLRRHPRPQQPPR